MGNLHYHFYGATQNVCAIVKISCIFYFQLRKHCLKQCIWQIVNKNACLYYDMADTIPAESFGNVRFDLFPGVQSAHNPILNEGDKYTHTHTGTIYFGWNTWLGTDNTQTYWKCTVGKDLHTQTKMPKHSLVSSELGSLNSKQYAGGVAIHTQSAGKRTEAI